MMNRRNAIRALILGAPAAAIGVIAAPAFASSFRGAVESGPELFTHPLGHTIVVNNGAIRFPDIARQVAYEIRQKIPDAIEAYKRNPTRGA